MDTQVSVPQGSIRIRVRQWYGDDNTVCSTNDSIFLPWPPGNLYLHGTMSPAMANSIWEDITYTISKFGISNAQWSPHTDTSCSTDCRKSFKGLWYLGDTIGDRGRILPPHRVVRPTEPPEQGCACWTLLMEKSYLQYAKPLRLGAVGYSHQPILTNTGI